MTEGPEAPSKGVLPCQWIRKSSTLSWRKSYRRCNVVEGVNAMLKGGFVVLRMVLVATLYGVLRRLSVVERSVPTCLTSQVFHAFDEFSPPA